MNPLSRILLKSIIILALITATFFTATGQVDVLLDELGGAILSDRNNQYLDQSFNRSLKGFLVLSTIKSGLAVLEGSEIGVGFSLEIGDIVQSIYDYVDIAWKTALAGGTILLLMQLILQTIALINHWCLFALLLLALLITLRIWLLPKRQKLSHVLRELLLFVSVITISLYMILPLSIACAAFLSKQITQPLVEEAYLGFESLQKDLTPHALNEKFFAKDQKNDSIWDNLDINSKLQNSKDAILKMVTYLDKITKDFAIWTIKIIAGYLFDCIVFPLAFFVAVYILVKKLLSYVIGVRKSHTLKKDFEDILARQFT